MTKPTPKITRADIDKKMREAMAVAGDIGIRIYRSRLKGQPLDSLKQAARDSANGIHTPADANASLDCMIAIIDASYDAASEPDAQSLAEQACQTYWNGRLRKAGV